MTAITLPSDCVPSAVQFFLRDFGGILTPFLGGPEQRLNRLGLRMGMRVTIPPKAYGSKGRVLVSRLIQAKTSSLRMPVPQPGFTVGSEGAPKVKTAASGGTALEIKGLPAAKALSEGQFFSIVHSARRYLHPLAADATANGSGDASVTLAIPMRVPVSINDVIELATPQIEGHVLPGDELNWSIGLDKMLDISFTVVESA